jgi:hypothetical protein
MRIIVLQIFIVLIIFENSGYGAGYYGSIGTLSLNRTSNTGTCPATTFPTIILDNIAINVISKTNATLTFTTGSGTPSKTTLSGTVSVSGIQFENFTITRNSCQSNIDIRFSTGATGNSTINGTITISATGGQTSSVSSGNRILTYYNGNFPGQPAQQANVIVTFPDGGNVGNTICSNTKIKFDVEGDHYNSVQMYCLGPTNNRVNIGSLVPNSDFFSVNTGETANSLGFYFSNQNLPEGNYRAFLSFNGSPTVADKQIGNFTVYSPFSNVTISPTPTNAVLCYGQAMTLSTNVSGVGVAYRWSDGSNAGQIYGINSPISQDYFVTVTKNGVCPVNSNIIRPTVIPDFTPQITPSKTNPCQGETVTLTLSPNEINTYNYLWSNGSTANTISATSNGSFSVKVTPKVGCSEKQSSALNLTFTPAIKGVEIGLPNSKSKAIFCKGESSMILTAKAAVGEDLSGVAYQWSGSQTGQANTLNITQGGNYSLTLSKNGCASSSTPLTVIANQSPTISSNPSDLRICEGSQATFTVFPNDKNNYEYQWFKGNTNNRIANAADAVLNVSQADTYIARLVPIGGNCTQFNEDSKVLGVDPNINGKLTPSGNAVICNSTIGLPLTASGDGAGINYLWSNGENSSAINVKTAGTFGVTMTRGKCIEKYSVTTKVENLTASISPVSNIIVCSGTKYQPYELKATSNFTNATFKWKKDNIDAPNATTTPSYTIPNLTNAAGDYSVEVEVTSLGCKSESNKVKVTTPPNFDVNITPLNPASICEGITQDFTANSTYSSSLLNYSWSNTTNTTNKLTTTTEGTYTATISQEGCKASNSSTLITKPSKPKITVVDGSLLIASESSNGLYKWYFNNTTTPISGATKQEYLLTSLSQSGKYFIQANRNNCGERFSDPLDIVYIITSSNPFLYENALSIYPNPVIETIEIIDYIQAQKTIELYDSSGKMIKVWNSNEKNTKLDLNSLNEGVYNLIIITKGKKVSKKILKM